MLYWENYPPYNCGAHDKHKCPQCDRGRLHVVARTIETDASPSIYNCIDPIDRERHPDVQRGAVLMSDGTVTNVY